MLVFAAFMQAEWTGFGEALWGAVAEALDCRRLGKKAKIPREDEMRRPGVKLLWGDDPWVSHVDNGLGPLALCPPLVAAVGRAR